MACSFIASGLRVFDISDLLHPKEIAYYVAPTQPRRRTASMASDFAMSQPAIVPARREVWYTDGATGFNVVRVAPEVWPVGPAGAPVPARGCLSRSAPIGPRGIGRVRLGMTRRALCAGCPRRSRRPGARGAGASRAAGLVSAAFTKSGRVALVAPPRRAAASARSPGSSTGLLRHRYPHHTRVGRAIVRANPRSTRIFGIRGGKVRHVAVTTSRTIARPRQLRGYLSRAGLR